MNIAFARCCLLLILSLLPVAASASADTEGLGSSCLGIQGRFAFKGQTLPGTREQVVATPPTITMILYPRSDLAYDPRIDWYRLVIDQGRPMLELHGRKGPVGRVPVADQRDFAYCLDDELTIERQRRSLAGSVYEYSRHRFRLRKAASGDLLVETDVHGRYRSWLSSWQKEPMHFAARFARLQ